MLAALSENWIFLFIVLVINNGNISCMRGILRDMLAGVTPIVLRKQVYASAAFVGAVLYACSYPFINHWTAMLLGAAVVVIIRMLAAKYLWNLPVAIPEDWPPKE